MNKHIVFFVVTIVTLFSPWSYLSQQESKVLIRDGGRAIYIEDRNCTIIIELNERYICFTI